MKARKKMLVALLVFLFCFTSCKYIGKGDEEIKIDTMESGEIMQESESEAGEHSVNLWMHELWPEWEEYQYDTAEVQILTEKRAKLEKMYYGENTSYAGEYDPEYLARRPWVVKEKIEDVMYASERQLVYSDWQLAGPMYIQAQGPYYGLVAGALEKGEEVHVVCSFFLQTRPQDGIYYLIDGSVGNPFFGVYETTRAKGLPAYKEAHSASMCAVWEGNEWVEIKEEGKVYGVVRSLSLEHGEERKKEQGETYVSLGKQKEEIAAWMSSVWSDWELYIPKPQNGFRNLSANGKYYYPIGKLRKIYYEEELFYSGMEPRTYEDAVMVQKEKTDVIMYATERQLVYAEILPTVKGPLKAPYYGPVVGALEKGEPVRVVSVIENQQRPEDGEYYGIAIDLEIGSTPFLSEYMDPFVERFGADAFGSNSAAYGYAEKLSPTPPEE